MRQVQIMCETAPEPVKVKVAGTGSFWTPMVVLGCMLLGVERIGTRNGPQIVEDMSIVLPMLQG
jgi:deoxyribose-phosphate aldolase